MTSKLKTSSAYATIQAFIRVIWDSPNLIWIISKCKYKFAAKKSRSVAQWVYQEFELISNPCPSLIVHFQSWVSFMMIFQRNFFWDTEMEVYRMKAYLLIKQRLPISLLSNVQTRDIHNRVNNTKNDVKRNFQKFFLCFENYE